MKSRPATKVLTKKFMSKFHTAIITAQNYGDMILNTK